MPASFHLLRLTTGPLSQWGDTKGGRDQLRAPKGARGNGARGSGSEGPQNGVWSRCQRAEGDTKPHQPCKGGVIIHRSVHTDPGHQTGRSALASHSGRGGVGGEWVHGRRVTRGALQPSVPKPAPQGWSPRRGVPLPLGEHTVILHPAQNTPRKWAEMAGSRLRRRRQTAVLAPGQVSAPQVSERAAPAPLGAWREGDPNSKNFQHPTGHNWQPQATTPRSTLGRV